MVDARVPRAGGRAALDRFGEEVAADWLSAVSRAEDGVVRPPELLAAYDALARATIERALGEGEDDDFAVERTVAEAAVSIRRAHLTISQALADVGLLARILVSTIAQHLEVPDDEGAETLWAATCVLEALTGTSDRLAHVLEASAVRHQREHSETLAAMTDQLSHELRNRLGATQTAADMLRNPDIGLDEDGLASLGSCGSASRRRSGRSGTCAIWSRAEPPSGSRRLGRARFPRSSGPCSRSLRRPRSMPT